MALIVVIILAFVYMIATDTTYITPEKIVHKSFTNPIGKTYDYNDVSGVDTGFYGDKRIFQHSKGDFYYLIRLNDGEIIDLSKIGEVNEDHIINYDTYREYEVFDHNIMKNHIPKISNIDNIEFSNLGEVYKDRLKSVILNQ